MLLQRLICHFITGENTKQADNTHLKSELAQTKEHLDLALQNLNNVIDPDLIDCCIYEVQAAQLRYKVLLREVKRTEAITINAPAALTTVSTVKGN